MASEKYLIKALGDIGKISDDGILVFNTQNNAVKYCNKALAGIIGHSITRIVNGGAKALRASIKDDDERLANLFELLKASSKITNTELRVVSAEAKYISVDAYWIERQHTVVALVKDVTKFKRHLDYIVEYGARKDTVLDAVAQSLSGPLNMTNNLLDVLDRLSAAQNYKLIEQPARMIRENTQQCIDVINSLIGEEHIAFAEVPAGSSRFDVRAKIRAIIDWYSEMNPLKQFMMVSSGGDLFAIGDDVKFFQVVNNLISNAVKFTRETGTVVVEVQEAASSIVVVVKDNGIGIPDYLQPHLFRKSTPAARPGLHGERSTGFGLYIVKKLVDMMNGEISFESEVGRGSSFAVAVPKNGRNS